MTRSRTPQHADRQRQTTEGQRVAQERAAPGRRIDRLQDRRTGATTPGRTLGGPQALLNPAERGSMPRVGRQPDFKSVALCAGDLTRLQTHHPQDGLFSHIVFQHGTCATTHDSNT